MIEKNRIVAADSYIPLSTVPQLKDLEVLNYDGSDENGNPTPESDLKRYVLESLADNVALEGASHCHGSGKVPSAEGIAGVGKTVA